MPRYLAAFRPDPDRKLRPDDFSPVEADDILAAACRFRAEHGDGPGPWRVIVGRDQPENRWPNGLPMITQEITVELRILPEGG